MYGRRRCRRRYHENEKRTSLFMNRSSLVKAFEREDWIMTSYLHICLCFAIVGPWSYSAWRNIINNLGKANHNNILISIWWNHLVVWYRLWQSYFTFGLPSNLSAAWYHSFVCIVFICFGICFFLFHSEFDSGYGCIMTTKIRFVVNDAGG